MSTTPGLGGLGIEPGVFCLLHKHSIWAASLAYVNALVFVVVMAALICDTLKSMEPNLHYKTMSYVSHISMKVLWPSGGNHREVVYVCL